MIIMLSTGSFSNVIGKTDTVNINDELINISHFSTHGNLVSVQLTDNLQSFVTNGGNFYLIFAFGSKDSWNSFVLFTYDANSVITIQYSIGDIKDSSFLWIDGDTSMYDVSVQNIDITYIEYSVYQEKPPNIAVIAFSSFESINDFKDAFAYNVQNEYNNYLTNPLNLITDSTESDPDAISENIYGIGIIIGICLIITMIHIKRKK
ncbi:MAG: hypothetical protein ACXAC7_05515 [Candidatus Hodarchaeales archaeon]